MVPFQAIPPRPLTKSESQMHETTITEKFSEKSIHKIHDSIKELMGSAGDAKDRVLVQKIKTEVDPGAELTDLEW